MKLKSILLGAILVWMAGMSPTWAIYEDKVNAERVIEAKAQHVLDTMFGPHKFSVVATAKMSDPSWAVKYTELAKVKMTKKDQKTYEILPGFTAIKNLSPDQMSRLPFNSTITRRGGKITGMSVTLVASKSIRKTDVVKAEKLLTEILKLNVDTTDSITTVFESFPISRKEKNKDAFFPFNFINVAILMGLMLLAIFIMMYQKLQKKQLQAIKESGESSAASDAIGDQSANTEPSLSQGNEPVTEEVESIKNFFGFIRMDNIQTLLDILEKEKLGLAHVSIIVSCLEPRCAATVLKTYSVEEQAEIVKHVMKQKLIEKSTIEKMEKLIKSRLESLIGGNRVLTDILNLVSNQNKKNVLDVVKKDPATYKLIRPNVFLIDDMELLKDDEMKLLISMMKMDVLATLMSTLQQKTRDKITSNLSHSGSAMLTQYIELKGDRSAVKELEEAEAMVLQVMLKLEDEGKIELKKRLGSL